MIKSVQIHVQKMADEDSNAFQLKGDALDVEQDEFGDASNGWGGSTSVNHRLLDEGKSHCCSISYKKPFHILMRSLILVHF